MKSSAWEKLKPFIASVLEGWEGPVGVVGEDFSTFDNVLLKRFGVAAI